VNLYKTITFTWY